MIVICRYLLEDHAGRALAGDVAQDGHRDDGDDGERNHVGEREERGEDALSHFRRVLEAHAFRHAVRPTHTHTHTHTPADYTLIGSGKGGNVTSAGWQVTLRDPIWHASSRSGEACCELLYPVTLLYFTLPCTLYNSLEWYK